MSWSRSSSLVLVALLAVVGVTLLVASPGAAATVDDDGVPDEAQVNDSVSVEFTLSDLYEGDTPREWTLVADTELDNADWTIRRFDGGGDQVGSSTETANATAEQFVSADENVVTVEVELRGDVPDVEEFSYEPRQTFTLATFTEQRPGGGETVLETYETHHFTEASQSARQAIDDAQAAIDEADEAGGDVSDAEGDLETAIALYNGGVEFGQAQSVAENAQDEAEDAESGAELRSLLLWGVGALLVVVVIAGVAYWYRQNQGPADPLG